MVRLRSGALTTPLRVFNAAGGGATFTSMQEKIQRIRDCIWNVSSLNR